MIFVQGMIQWKCFLHYWPFAWGIHRWLVDSPSTDTVMTSSIYYEWSMFQMYWFQYLLSTYHWRKSRNAENIRNALSISKCNLCFKWNTWNMKFEVHFQWAYFSMMLGLFHKGLWADVWDIINKISSYFYSNNPIRSQICTCHNSSAVVGCAKFWTDMIIIFYVRAICVYTKFELWAHKPFVKWVCGVLSLMLDMPSHD